MVKNLPANEGDTRDSGLIPGSGTSPRRGNGPPTPVFLPRDFYGQMGLAGFSPYGSKGSDTAEHAHIESP